MGPSSISTNYGELQDYINNNFNITLSFASGTEFVLNNITDIEHGYIDNAAGKILTVEFSYPATPISPMKQLSINMYYFEDFLSESILGSQATIIDSSASGIGYICPESTPTYTEVVFGHTTELGLEKGKEYRLSFNASSEEIYSIAWDLWIPTNIGDENDLQQEWFTVTPNGGVYEWTISVDEDYASEVSLRFLNVQQDGTTNYISSPIHVSNIQIIEK